MNSPLGERLDAVVKIVASKQGETLPDGDRLLARVGGRLLEEAVELALELGADPKDVMGHVMDAIHNEARKAMAFPTQMGVIVPDREAVLGEIADVSCMVDYLGYQMSFAAGEVYEAQRRKIVKLTDAAHAGEMVMIDGLIYRKVSRS